MDSPVSPKPVMDISAPLKPSPLPQASQQPARPVQPVSSPAPTEADTSTATELQHMTQPVSTRQPVQRTASQLPKALIVVTIAVMLVLSAFVIYIYLQS